MRSKQYFRVVFLTLGNLVFLYLCYIESVLIQNNFPGFYFFSSVQPVLNSSRYNSIALYFRTQPVCSIKYAAYVICIYY